MTVKLFFRSSFACRSNLEIYMIYLSSKWHFVLAILPLPGHDDFVFNYTLVNIQHTLILLSSVL